MYDTKQHLRVRLCLFLCLMAIKTSCVIECRAILIEERHWYYLTHSWRDKRVLSFPNVSEGWRYSFTGVRIHSLQCRSRDGYPLWHGDSHPGEKDSILVIQAVCSTSSLLLLLRRLWSVRVSSMHQIDMVENNLYFIGSCAKNSLETTQTS